MNNQANDLVFGCLRQLDFRRQPLSPQAEQQIDPEIIGLVKKLNTVNGLSTNDSCFGHRGEPSGSQQEHAFVGLHIKNPGQFLRFFRYVLACVGSGFVERHGLAFRIQLRIIIDPVSDRYLTMLCIEPRNPLQARLEKLAGIEVLEEVIDNFLKQQSAPAGGPREALG